MRAGAEAPNVPRCMAVWLGAFLGAHLCRRFRASWREDPDSGIETWHVVWVSGHAVCPFALIGKRLAEGPPASILAQMAALTKLLIERGDAEDPLDKAPDWFAQADAFAKKDKRLPLAVRFATGALGCGGDAPPRRIQLAGWCRALGKPAEAAAHIDAALRQDATSAPAWLERARIDLDRKDPAAAARSAERSLALAETADALVLRAWALGAQAAHADALDSHERTLLLDPTRIEALLGMAGMLITMDRPKEALSWLENIAGRSDAEPARSILAALAADTAGEPVKAHALNTRLKDWSSVPADKREHAARRAAELAEDPAVLPLFDEAIAADGLSGYSWLNRGTCLRMMSREEEALESYRTAEALLGPMSTVIKGKLACLLHLGRGDEAVRCADRALSVGAPSPEDLRLKANTLMRIGRPGDALPIYQRLIAHLPGDDSLLREWNEALRASGAGGIGTAG